MTYSTSRTSALLEHARGLDVRRRATLPRTRRDRGAPACGRRARRRGVPRRGRARVSTSHASKGSSVNTRRRSSQLHPARERRPVGPHRLETAHDDADRIRRPGGRRRRSASSSRGRRRASWASGSAGSATRSGARGGSRARYSRAISSASVRVSDSARARPRAAASSSLSSALGPDEERVRVAVDHRQALRLEEARARAR